MRDGGITAHAVGQSPSYRRTHKEIISGELSDKAAERQTVVDLPKGTGKCIQEGLLVEWCVPPTAPAAGCTAESGDHITETPVLCTHDQRRLAECITWMKRIVHPQRPRQTTTTVTPNRPQPPEGRCVCTSLYKGALCCPSSREAGRETTCHTH